MEILNLDQNEQTDEVLKHIYTVLDLNKNIEITIDNADFGNRSD